MAYPGPCLVNYIHSFVAPRTKHQRDRAVSARNRTGGVKEKGKGLEHDKGQG